MSRACNASSCHETTAATVLQTLGQGIHKVKAYHHYAYKMESAPPFRICQISKEIPLVTRKTPRSQRDDWTHQRIWKDTSQTAYISGLYLKGDTMLMSYGSSDIDSRLLQMSIQQLEDLFDGNFDCSGSEVQDYGSGQMPNSVLQHQSSNTHRVEYKHRHHHLKHRRAHHRDGSGAH